MTEQTYIVSHRGETLGVYHAETEARALALAVLDHDPGPEPYDPPLDAVRACDHCVECAEHLSGPEHLGHGDYHAVWVDDEGRTNGRVSRVCYDCLTNGSDRGPSYVEVERPFEPRHCEACYAIIDPREPDRVVYCGRCGDPR